MFSLRVCWLLSWIRASLDTCICFTPSKYIHTTIIPWQLLWQLWKTRALSLIQVLYLSRRFLIRLGFCWWPWRSWTLKRGQGGFQPSCFALEAEASRGRLGQSCPRRPGPCMPLAAGVHGVCSCVGDKDYDDVQDSATITGGYSILSK